MYFTIKHYHRKIQTQQARMGENGTGIQSTWLFAYPDSVVYYCLVSGKSIIKAQAVFNFDKNAPVFNEVGPEYINVDSVVFGQIDPEIMADISDHTTAFETLMIADTAPVQSDIIYIPTKDDPFDEKINPDGQSLFNTLMTKIKTLKK